MSDQSNKNKKKDKQNKKLIFKHDDLMKSSNTCYDKSEVIKIKNDTPNKPSSDKTTTKNLEFTLNDIPHFYNKIKSDTNIFLKLHDFNTETEVITSTTNQRKQKMILKIINSANFNACDLNQSKLFIPNVNIGHSTNKSYQICKLLKLSNIKENLLLGIGKKELLIGPYGLINHISSFQGYSIFGTRSLKTELAELIDDYCEDDKIDFYLNIQSDQSTQCFYISFDFLLNKYFLTSLIDFNSEQSKLYYRVNDKIRLDFTKSYIITIGSIFMKLKFNISNNIEQTPVTFCSTRDDAKRTISIEIVNIHDNKPNTENLLISNKKIFNFDDLSDITIGTSTKNKISIDNDFSISKNHCIIRYSQLDESWYLIDGNSIKQSTNGVWILMKKDQSLELSDDCVQIKMGQFVFGISNYN